MDKYKATPEKSTENLEALLASRLSSQEDSRMQYWSQYDPFIDVRMGWRASTMRHLFHILPGQKILEIGAGDGKFTQALLKATRNECEIISVVFSKKFEEKIKSQGISDKCNVMCLEDFPGPLRESKFDYIVAHHMMEDRTRDDFLRVLRLMLNPGGGLLLFELNPWNIYFRMRRTIHKLLPIKWRRPAEAISLNRYQVLTVFSGLGYSRINAVPYDFLYSPVPKFLLWPAKHLSIIMENCPFIRNLAGSLYIWAFNGNVDEKDQPPLNLCEHEMFKGKISFVVPCHNEEMNIGPMAAGLKRFYNDYIHEIIIVDDNSTDNTLEVAYELAEDDKRIKVLKRSPPNGVGRALREGLQMAEGEFIMIMDSDFQEIIPEMRDLFEAMANGADVVLGSRFSRDSVLLNYPFTKIIANRAFHVLVDLFIGKMYRDVSNNLKIMKHDVAKKIMIECNDFAANAETGLKPILMGYNVVEVPISWINRSINMGLSSFKIMKTGPNYFQLLIRLVWRRWSKKENNG